MTAEQLLNKYIAFAAMDKDNPALEKKAETLTAAVADFIPTFDFVEGLPTGFAQELHAAVNSNIDCITTNEPNWVNLNHVQLGWGGRNITVDFIGGTADVYIGYMYIIMFRARVKAIIRCQGCGKAILRTKGNRKTCSDKCRARKCAANRTPEQKEQLRKKRQERYLISKGGNK